MWAGTKKGKLIWILLKQETVSGSGISWAVCKSAPRSRQITTPAPHYSVLYRPDALPAAQPTASKHWRHRPCLCTDNWQPSLAEQSVQGNATNNQTSQQVFVQHAAAAMLAVVSHNESHWLISAVQWVSMQHTVCRLPAYVISTWHSYRPTTATKALKRNHPIKNATWKKNKNKWKPNLKQMCTLVSNTQ